MNSVKNWKEIYDWLIGLGFPEDFSQSIHRNIQNPTLQTEVDANVYSDGTLTVLTSNKRPNIKINFKDMYPISLSPLPFDTTQTDIQYLEAEVEFAYRNFEIAT